MMCSPQGGLSAGAMCRRRRIGHASGHPRAQQLPLGRDPPPPVWGWAHLAKGERGPLPSPGQVRAQGACSPGATPALNRKTVGGAPRDPAMDRQLAD